MFLFDLIGCLDDFGWIAARNDHGRNVLHHHAAGGDDTPPSDAHSGEHDGVGADPDTIFDHDGLAIAVGVDAVGHIFE